MIKARLDWFFVKTYHSSNEEKDGEETEEKLILYETNRKIVLP